MSKINNSVSTHLMFFGAASDLMPIFCNEFLVGLGRICVLAKDTLNTLVEASILSLSKDACRSRMVRQANHAFALFNMCLTNTDWAAYAKVWLSPLTRQVLAQQHAWPNSLQDLGIRSLANALAYTTLHRDSARKM